MCLYVIDVGSNFMYGIIYDIILATSPSFMGRRGAGAQVCDCNATVVGSSSTRWDELLFINISISLL